MERACIGWIGSIVLAVLISSCGGKSNSAGASCSRAAAHVETMVRSALSEIQGDEAKTLLSSVPSLIKNIQKKCEKEDWSAQLIQCVLDSKDQTSVDRCESLLKQERGTIGGGDAAAPNDTKDQH